MRENPFIINALHRFCGIGAVQAQHPPEKRVPTGFPNCGTVWHEYGQ